MQSATFRAHKARNELHRCDLRGCGHHRSGINRWCTDHLRRANLYGHPEAPPLRPHQWNEERQEVRRLLSDNADHPGLRSVIAFITSWSEQACANEHAFKGADEVARVIRHGVKPLDIVTEVAAFRLWMTRHPGILPDQRSEDFALARAVFGLAPRIRRHTRGPGGAWPVTIKAPATWSYSPKPTKAALGYVGSHLRGTLAPLLANVALAVETRAQAQADHEAALRAPFKAL